MGVSNEYIRSSNRIMIIGQETKNFGLYTDDWPMNDIREWGIDYLQKQLYGIESTKNKCNYNRSAFWKLFRLLEQKGFAPCWNNIDKIQQTIDEKTVPFSFSTNEKPQNKVVCHISYTNDDTKRVILENINRSPLYAGEIEGVGPRYCPSIEDKIVRFADKKRHQFFIEPCGENTEEMYLQGMSSSLPEEVQIEIKGQTLPYVSRGGLKLEKALRDFGVDPTGYVCSDSGASTGGFTDCLLQKGAKKVFAIDVGYGQLAWSIRTDPRVVCMERTNVRYVTHEQIPDIIVLAVIL